MCREEHISCLNQTLFNLFFHFRKNKISSLGTIHLRRRQIFMIFDPYHPTIGIPAKCLWRVFLILMYCDLSTIGTWGHSSPLRHADVLNGWSLKSKNYCTICAYLFRWKKLRRKRSKCTNLLKILPTFTIKITRTAISPIFWMLPASGW